MNKYELNDTIDKLSGMVFGEMGSNMLDNDAEDVLKALKVMKIAKKLVLDQNNDIEELKNRIILMDEKLDRILHNIKRNKGEA